jgi:hypothetical protein
VVVAGQHHAVQAGPQDPQMSKKQAGQKRGYDRRDEEGALPTIFRRCLLDGLQIGARPPKWGDRLHVIQGGAAGRACADLTRGRRGRPC